jgi:hypothetical protein
MGLKFRRGTNAQKSGSLAFGEPYVNTDLGTLQIGGATGDITLGASGTGSQGSFAGISGSSLDITGNAKIDGNLTLGGAITIGDATADTVNVVASLSSSLIPQTTNAFDLGSADKIWRDLYISTGSIKFVEGTSVVKSLSAATLTALEAATGSSNTSITNLNSFTSSIDTTIKTKINTDGVISGSSQILGGSGIVTGSSQITYANISSIPAGIVSGSSQVTGIGNAQLTNSSITIAGTSTALGSSVTSDQIRSALGTLFSGSSQVNYTSITGIPGGIVSSSLQTIANLPTGVVSGSTQVTPLLPTGTVSGSSQVTISSTTGYGTIINQALLTTSAVTHGNLTINGTITATGDITAFFTSDKRHKNNIQIIPNALDKVSKLNGVTWEWNDDVNEVTKSTPKTGLIAQEVQEVLPEVIKTREDGFLALDYSKMMGLLVEAIKEQQKQIEELKAQIGS